jgi:hypothetical protein
MWQSLNGCHIFVPKYKKNIKYAQKEMSIFVA